MLPRVQGRSCVPQRRAARKLQHKEARVGAVKRMGLRLYGGFERIIVFILLIMLMAMVAWGTGILAIELIGNVAGRLSGGAPPPVAELQEFFDRFRLLHEVFGSFLLILIGLELMKTVVMYLDRHELHVEVVFTVAMIAIARHAIDLNLATTQPMTLIGMAALIVGLSVGYYFFRKSSGMSGRKSGPEYGGAEEAGAKPASRME
jgi:uncharacterized membrane protein (DUF373 family)